MDIDIDSPPFKEPNQTHFEQPVTYVYCPRCMQLHTKIASTLNPVCCSLSTISFGTGKCSICNNSIPIENSKDICYICAFRQLTVS
jgi:hypothetical protein